ncbi:MAG: Uma2 family endonuclease [Pirellulales bacterium]|nr:Uma2 family endonuclease [Pirellulales bacterium]
MASATALLTAAEFWQLPASRTMRRELVRGEVIESMPPGGRHSRIVAKLIMRLGFWAESSRQGEVCADAGFHLSSGPDTVRGPDVYYVRAARVPATGVPVRYWEIPPDLAIEVVSLGDSAAEIHEKVADYLNAGTHQVWVVYPSTQVIVIHTPDSFARTLRVNDTLTAPDLLPGFSCPVAELFAN